jgi:cytochrome b561
MKHLFRALHWTTYLYIVCDILFAIWAGYDTKREPNDTHRIVCLLFYGAVLAICIRTTIKAVKEDLDKTDPWQQQNFDKEEDYDVWDDSENK